MKEIFKNLKVLELASVLAGPRAGTFFSELGAEVIKIENKKTQGDVTRGWKLPSENADEISAYYSSVNFGKKVLFLDLTNEADFEIFLQEVINCDVLISNFKKDSAIKLGVDFESLKKINPTIIYAQITGFESNDKRVAYDAVLQAEAGFMSMTGEKDGAPVKFPVAIIDVLAAHQLKEGILLALWQSKSDARAYYVECSLEKTALASLVNQSSNYLMANHIPGRMGSKHPNIAPYGEIFTSIDTKSYILAIGSDKQFQLLCTFLNLSLEERFKKNKYRVENREALYNILLKTLEELKYLEVFQFCENNFIPIGEIKTLDKVLNSELAKSMILEEEIDGVNTKRLSSVAFKLK